MRIISEYDSKKSIRMLLQIFVIIYVAYFSEAQHHQKPNRVKQKQRLNIVNRTSTLTVDFNATWRLISASRGDSSERLESESVVSQSDRASESGIGQRVAKDAGTKIQVDPDKEKKRGQQPETVFGSDVRDMESSQKFSNEYHIKQRILRSYDKTCRPVRNDSTPTTLHVGMSLYHILDTNEKFQTLSSLIAVRLRWLDEYLQWNASEFGGVDQIWIPAPRIWTPDIFISNFVDDSFKDCMDTNAIVSSSGHVLWMFPAVVKTYCTLDVKHFPFDRQNCSIVFISWTFNGLRLNVTYDPHEQQAIYYTPRNQEWFVDGVTVERHERIYACCPEPYPDVTFTLQLTRRSLFYVVNLIFPCLLIYAVSFVGFFLPVESGEKITLEITVLLALVVFLLIVGETLPPNSDAIPALGMLFGLTMVMVSIALVMAVIVTNIYLRKDMNKRVPAFLCWMFLRRIDDVAHLRRRSTQFDLERSNCPKRIPGVDVNGLSVLNASSQWRDSKISGVQNNNHSAPPFVCNVWNIEAKCRRCRCISRKPRSDWMDLAKAVDRFFFWFFLTSSLACLLAMFAAIP